MGDLPVQAVDVGLVMKAVDPLWNQKTERQAEFEARIESVLDWATARDYRTGENPVRWRDQAALCTSRTLAKMVSATRGPNRTATDLIEDHWKMRNVSRRGSIDHTICSFRQVLASAQHGCSRSAPRVWRVSRRVGLISRLRPPRWPAQPLRRSFPR
jgi:hypothetical protein